MACIILFRKRASKYVKDDHWFWFVDSLIDTIEEGQCYLFYGSNKAMMELLTDCS